MRILPTVKIKHTYIMRLAILLLFFLGGLQQNYAVDLGELRHEIGVEKSAVGSNTVKSWKSLLDEGVDPSIRKNVDALTDPDAAIDAIQTSQKTKPTWPEIKALFKRGNDFNKKGVAKYTNSKCEIHLAKVNGKAARLDTYIPGEKIISRKATSIDEITETTWRGYCSELVNKYKVGRGVNSSKMPGEPPLSGKYFLEIPASNQSAQKLADFKAIAKQYGTENGGIDVIFLVE